jgi:hypothetical protein
MLLIENNGMTFTVKYLKECVRIVQHFVSGNPISVTTEMPVSLARGIPTIIPGNLRLLMHSKDHRVIRGVLTVLSTYRILKISPVLKLGSITDHFKGSDPTLPRSEILRVLHSLPRLGRLDPIKILQLRSAGPNVKVSMLGI